MWDLGCKAIDPELTVESEKWIRKTERNELDEEQRWNGIGTNSFLVGMESEHDNKAEDRTYSFFTARSDNFRLQECSEWTKLNDFDKEVDLRLEGDEVIERSESVQSDIISYSPADSSGDSQNDNNKDTTGLWPMLIRTAKDDLKLVGDVIKLALSR